MQLRIRPSVLVTGLAVASLLLAPSIARRSGAAAATPSDAPLLLSRGGSTSVVFALGSTCATATSPCLRLFRTTDDGRHFGEVTAPPASRSQGSPTGTLRALRFATPSDGIALEGPGDALYARSLYVTTNGATTWTKASLGAGRSVVAAAATSTKLYVVTTHCPHANQPCGAFQLLRSSVTTPSWTATSLANAAGLAAFGATVAAFGPDVWLSEATAKGAPELAVSHDGGTTFQLHAAPKLTAVTPCELFAVSQSALWARCPTGMLVSFLHSADRGATWIGARVGPVAGTGGGAFDPLTARTAYLARGGSPDVLYRVTGTTGRAEARGTVPYSDLASLVFTDAVHGMAVGFSRGATASRLARTSTAGTSWKQVALPR